MFNGSMWFCSKKSPNMVTCKLLTLNVVAFYTFSCGIFVDFAEAGGFFALGDKRVILGISYSQSMDLGTMIEDELEERGMGDVECILAHTKSAVETFLKRDSSVVGVILLRDMSVSSPYTAREMVMLAESYPSIVFVPVCMETYKGSTFAQELLEGGVYNMVFNCDSSLGEITSRIVRPYNRRDARRYYGLIGENEKKVTVVSENNGLSDESYYSYLEFLQADGDGENTLLDKLGYVKNILDSSTFLALLLRLPDSMKNKISQLPGYENIYAEAVKTTEEEKSEKAKRPPRKEDTAAREIPSEVKKVFDIVTDTFEVLLGKLGSGIKEVVKGKGGEEEENGIRKFLAKTNKEFERLEYALTDELGAEQTDIDIETTAEVKPDVSMEKLDVKAEVVALELEQDESTDAVVLQEEHGEADSQPERLTEVVVMNEELEESSVPVRAVEVAKQPHASVNPEISDKEDKKEQKRRERQEKKAEKAEKKKEARVKPVYIGSVVLAVTSIKKGVGCSHVARLLANYMSQVEKRHTCFIDCSRPLYSSPEGLLPGIDVLTFSELTAAYSRYDCIVMDIGSDYKRFQSEIIRATIKVMCCTADDEVMESVYRFMMQNSQSETWVYAYNHVQSKVKTRRVEELMEDYKYILIPANDEENLTRAVCKDIRRVLTVRR